MFSKEMTQTLYNYHYWANARILECAARVTEADYYAPTDLTHGSLHEILFHIYRAESVWRHICQEGKAPPPGLRAEDIPTLPELTARFQFEEQAMRQFIAGLSPAEIEGERDVIDWRGLNLTIKLWRILVHLTLHGMQHRSEAAALLTRYGQSPGDLDFIFYEE